jgi:hypothetical protein
MNNEIWKKIEGYQYEVSNEGRIRNSKGEIKVPQLNKGKAAHYYRIALYEGGKRERFYVHRLVGQYFVDGYNEVLMINHKDGNPLNNKADNLEWVTQSDNVKHWYRELKTK